MLRAAISGAGHRGTRLIESVQGQSAKIGFVAGVSCDTDVLADPDIDAVVLATPHSQHATEIMAAAILRSRPSRLGRSCVYSRRPAVPSTTR